MTARAEPGLVYACLTHVPLWVDMPPYVTPIYSGEAQGPGRLNLRDLAPEWEPFHPVLGGTAGAFALKNLLLRQYPEATQVGICQYRKFVSRKRLGLPAQNYKVMDVLDRAQLQARVLAEAMLPDGPGFLVGQPGQFAVGDVSYDYLYQYKDVHHVEDLLRFTSEAVELGVLHKNEVIPFFGEKVFFPGGIELGFFPAGFWIASISAVESVVRVCVQRYPMRREGAQARVWSFCVERLGSYLLLKHLRTLHGPTDWLTNLTGHLNLITEDSSAGYVPGA